MDRGYLVCMRAVLVRRRVSGAALWDPCPTALSQRLLVVSHHEIMSSSLQTRFPFLGGPRQIRRDAARIAIPSPGLGAAAPSGRFPAGSPVVGPPQADLGPRLITPGESAL
ncbi:hypothetical protein Ssi02_13050 [Sinosporangium siamense]|uniref:Uncharacterized protein n=1 Tax=Sinosporangium siamense TaxID=1367973 RepID=A0A919RFX9_9ACTN|nr:hypothetical protein Ssi02_13050 [Sinosporangium siamense]